VRERQDTNTVLDPIGHGCLTVSVEDSQYSMVAFETLLLTWMTWVQRAVCGVGVVLVIALPAAKEGRSTALSITTAARTTPRLNSRDADRDFVNMAEG
jgi:hypothetical protein